MKNQPRFTITVDGLNEISNKFDGAKEIVEHYLQQAINFSLPEIQAQVRRHTPVITGRLRGGITYIEKAENYLLPGAGTEKLSGMVISTVFYGQYVHKNTPFFDMAMPKSKGIASRRFQQAVDAIITELE